LDLRPGAMREREKTRETERGEREGDEKGNFERNEVKTLFLHLDIITQVSVGWNSADPRARGIGSSAMNHSERRRHTAVRSWKQICT